MRSEFGFIKTLRNNFNISKIGDDCAVLPKDSENDLLITADLLVEDIDFRLKWAPPALIGHKALAVSISDIAAMGGKPTSSLLSIGLPEKIWKTDFADEFYSGYMELAKVFGVELVGGDVSQSPDKIVIDSIVLGEVEKGRAILRSTAKPGDLVFVTGDLGGAAAALEILEAGERFGESKADQLILSQLRPMPRVEEARILSESGIATSMIDISDGLSSDLAHICSESGVGAQIDAINIPIDKNLEDFQISDERKLALALHGGEDFELLFTVRSKSVSDQFLSDCFELGKITADVGRIELARMGETKILTPKGFRHF